jgi:putative transcriptional regulator
MIMAQRKKMKRQRLGERLVSEFSELRDALVRKEPIEKRFTVRTVELDLKPKEFDSEAVRVVRMSLSVSQAVFAQLLAVSTDLVASWEQGIRKPSGPACRVLELMEKDKTRWLRVLDQNSKKLDAVQS